MDATAFEVEPEITNEDRNWAALCHLSGVLALFVAPGFGHILAPLIVWLFKRHDSAFVDEHGKEALNFQFSISLYMVPFFILLVVSLFQTFVVLVIITMFFIWFFSLIYASIQANEGMEHRFPCTIHFL